MSQQKVKVQNEREEWCNVTTHHRIIFYYYYYCYFFSFFVFFDNQSYIIPLLRERNWDLGKRGEEKKRKEGRTVGGNSVAIRGTTR